MESGEVVALALGLSLTAIVVVAFICVFIAIGRKSRRQKAQNEYAARYSEKSNSPKVEQTARHMSAAEKHVLHVKDSHEHGHSGEEEHYDEIVGSLGEVNDEGCEDLSGVRFIAHDLSYELSEDDNIDYTGIAQAMVIGEILNTPRFKKPYYKNK